MAYSRSRRSTRRSAPARRTRRTYGRTVRVSAPSRASREIRLVIQTPSDMLPARPTVGQFARARRRARF